MTNHDDALKYGDDDDMEPDEKGRFKEFDCPSCSANNPMDDGFVLGDEISCHYCGSTYLVVLKGENKFKLRER